MRCVGKTSAVVVATKGGAAKGLVGATGDARAAAAGARRRVGVVGRRRASPPVRASPGGGAAVAGRGQPMTMIGVAGGSGVPGSSCPFVMKKQYLGMLAIHDAARRHQAQELHEEGVRRRETAAEICAKLFTPPLPHRPARLRNDGMFIMAARGSRTSRSSLAIDRQRSLLN